MQIPGLYIGHTDRKGRGVFTAMDIHEGDTIEICPVVVIPALEMPMIHKSCLHDYYFVWDEDKKSGAIALGFGSLYNHEVFPNADFIVDYEQKVIEIVAIRDIKGGSEVTINYHGESGSDEKLWFSM